MVPKFHRRINRFSIPLLATLISISSQASPEIDRTYTLETLGWLKTTDNVDGIFNEFVDETYSTYFKEQSRFQIKKVPEIPNPRDLVALRQIAREIRVESLIRTQVVRLGESYRFKLEWVYAPRGDILAQSEFQFFDPKNADGLKNSNLPIVLKNALDDLIQKLPFLGQVTGVDGNTVTINLGRNQGIYDSVILEIATLDAVKRHPIEQTIEEWRWTDIGQVQVNQIEESISFAKTFRLENGKEIDRYQKIRRILPPPPVAVTKESGTEEITVPRLGWVSGGLGIGTYSREVGSTGSNSGFGGGGFSPSAHFDGQVWFNSRWLAKASVFTSILKYNATDLQSGNDLGASYSGSMTQIRVAAGYSFFPTISVFDPTGWVHFGYRNTAYGLTTSTTNFSGSSSFSSAFIGLGGNFPITPEFSTHLEFDLGVLRSVTEKDLNLGAAGSTADIFFSIGGAYRFNQNIFFRLSFQLNSQSADFDSGRSLNQKTFSLLPSVMYYF